VRKACGVAARLSHGHSRRCYPNRYPNRSPDLAKYHDGCSHMSVGFNSAKRAEIGFYSCWSFVMVFAPLMSSTVNVTLSPARRALNDKPSAP